MMEVVPSQLHKFMVETTTRFFARLLALFISLACMFSLVTGSAKGQAVNEVWTSFYQGSNSLYNCQPSAMALDASGNIYVAGTLYSLDTLYCFATIKYDPQGNQVWAALYGTNIAPLFVGNLQINSDGKVFLTGFSGEDAFVIKYDEYGKQLSDVVSANLAWLVQRFSLQPSGAFSLVGINEYGSLLVENYDATGNLLSSHESAPAFSAERLRIDASTNIVAGGTSYDTNSIPTIGIARYDSTGSLLWKTNYNGPQGGNIYLGNFTTDTNGNTFVAGFSVDTNDYGKMIVMKYDSQGNRSWVSYLDEGPGVVVVPNGVELDGFGNLLVIESDFTVIKYNDQGMKLWESRPSPIAGSTYLSSFNLDRSGNLYISGETGFDSQPGEPWISDRITLKFDTEGHELWVQRDSPGTNWSNFPVILEVDDSSNVVVAGYTIDNSDPIHNPKCITTMYSQTNIAGLPAILHDPESVRTTELTTVTFNVSATGDGPLTYQWSYNNQPMPGQTNASLILTNVAEDSVGAYSVTISNSVGWIRSRDADLILIAPPIIDAQPVQLQLALGESSVLHVFAHGDLPLSFQWQRNGTNLPAITNETALFSPFSSSLILTNVSLLDQGDYRVIVSNNSGSVTSAVSQVRISGQIHTGWASSFTGPTSYFSYSGLTAMDTDGNIYICGSIADLNDHHDYLTVKMDSTGHQLWSKRYEGTGGDEILTSIVLDRLGNVCVTGNSQNSNGNYEIATIKYDTDGNLIWLTRNEDTNGSSDFPSQIAVDDASNVFVTGVSYDTNDLGSYVTTKYSASGEQVWHVYAQPINDARANALAVDHNGDVLVAGNGGVIKYSSSGAELWRSGPILANQIRTDSNNNVYVLTTPSADVIHYRVEKYDPNGHFLWSSTYAGSGESIDMAGSFSVTEDGSVYVAGVSFNLGISADYLTVKIDRDGQLVWAARFSDGPNSYNQILGLAVDDFGNAYVTGNSWIGDIGYVTTLKYDRNGNQVWGTRYFPFAGAISAADVVIANQTNIFVTAVTRGVEDPADTKNFTVMAYEQNNGPYQPLILTPPQGQTVYVNSNAVLNVTGSDGTVQYQWRHFGENIPGATNSSLVITNFQPQDGGDYSVILDNGVDTAVSPEARLTPYTQLFSPKLRLPDQFGFTLVGEISRTFEVQRSYDLMTWDSLTNLFNTNGVIEFTDLSLTNGAKVFYRAKKSDW
jgi:Immunoglobulin domain/Beta-propeller repeat